MWAVIGTVSRRTGADPLLALGQLAVAADVAALGADDDVDGVVGSAVADLARGRGVDAGQPARPERVRRAVAELDLDPPRVHEVELLLALVQVKAGLDPGRQDDRVDAELGHAELACGSCETRNRRRGRRGWPTA